MKQAKLFASNITSPRRCLGSESALPSLDHVILKHVLGLPCRSLTYAYAPLQRYKRTLNFDGSRFITQYIPKPQSARLGPRQQLESQSEVPQNERIKAFKVHLVQVDGKLGEPILLHDALAARKKDEKGNTLEHLRQVRESDARIVFPVCRYYNIKEERDKVLAQKKSTRVDKTAKSQNKRLEFNWTVGDNDLGHRMVKMKEFLSKGRAVEVVIGGSRKKGWLKKKPDSPETARNLIARIKAAALEVDGAKERQEMKGGLGHQVELYFDAPKAKEDSPLK